MWRSKVSRNMNQLSGELYASRAGQMLTVAQSCSSVIPVGTLVARRSARQYLSNGQGKFVPRSAITGFPNSDKRNRYSGVDPHGKLFEGYTDGEIEDASWQESALYVSTIGSNGLAGAMVAELGYYQGARQNSREFLQGVEYVEQFRAGQADRAEPLRQMMWPTKILPGTDIVVQFATTSAYRVVDLTDPYVTQSFSMVLKDELIEFKKILRDEESRPSLIRFKEGLLKEYAFDIFKTDVSKPVQMSTALNLELYNFTQVIGNVLLRNNYAVKFPSARSALVAHADYLDGSANVALPMEAGQMLNLEPQALIWVEPTPQLPRVVKVSKQRADLTQVVINPVKMT